MTKEKRWRGYYVQLQGSSPIIKDDFAHCPVFIFAKKYALQESAKYHREYHVYRHGSVLVLVAENGKVKYQSNDEPNFALGKQWEDWVDINTIPLQFSVYGVTQIPRTEHLVIDPSLNLGKFLSLNAAKSAISRVDDRKNVQYEDRWTIGKHNNVQALVLMAKPFHIVSDPALTFFIIVAHLPLVEVYENAN